MLCGTADDEIKRGRKPVYTASAAVKQPTGLCHTRKSWGLVLQERLGEGCAEPCLPSDRTACKPVKAALAGHK